MSDPCFTPFTPVATVPGSDFQPWAAAPFLQNTQGTTRQNDDEFARGLAEGQLLAEAGFAEERRAWAALIASAQALQPESRTAIGQLMLEQVERLVCEVTGQMPVDRDWLIEQIDFVIIMAEKIEGARTLWLHPNDIELLSRQAIAVDMRADASLMRGSLRLELDEGSIEHGRMVMLDHLRSELQGGAQ